VRWLPSLLAAIAVAASPLAAGAQNVALLTGCASGTVAADSHAYYAVDVEAGAAYCFTMEGSGESDLDLWLHDINNFVLEKDVSERASGSILFSFERPGRYFLRVENKQHPTRSSFRVCEARAAGFGVCP